MTEPANGRDARARAVRERYEAEARDLISTNAARFPDLLVYQFATAMRERDEATGRAKRMTDLAAVCLRLAERADVKPKGDEVEAVKLAEELVLMTPSRRGGDGWIDGGQLRIDFTQENQAA